MNNIFLLRSFFIFMNSLSVVLGSTSFASSLTFSEQQAREQFRLGLTQESAETYARIGETLLGSESVYYAHLMFEKALQIDSNNLRANFYSAFVGPMVQLRGFGKRSEEYFRLRARSNHVGSSLDRAVGELELDELQDGSLSDLRDSVQAGFDYPGTHLNRFLFEDSGKPSIQSSEQLRQFIQNEMLASMEKGITRIRKVSGKAHELKLYLSNPRMVVLPGVSFPRGDSVFNANCYFDSRIQSIVCDSVGSFATQIQETQLQGGILAYDYYIQLARLFTAYKLDGYEAISSRLWAAGNANGDVQYRRFVSLISRFPSFLTLDSSSKLTEVMAASRGILTRLFEMGSDAQLLCASSYYQFALCYLVRDFDAYLALEKVVQGEVTVLMGYDARYQPVRIKMNVPAWFARPTADLKRLLPAVGDVDQLPDATLGGLFPNGDLPAKLKGAIYSIKWQIE